MLSTLYNISTKTSKCFNISKISTKLFPTHDIKISGNLAEIWHHSFSIFLEIRVTTQGLHTCIGGSKNGGCPIRLLHTITSRNLEMLMIWTQPQILMFVINLFNRYGWSTVIRFHTVQKWLSYHVKYLSGFVIFSFFWIVE